MKKRGSGNAWLTRNKSRQFKTALRRFAELDIGRNYIIFYHGSDFLILSFGVYLLFGFIIYLDFLI
jgi:hypothetical protein